MNPTRWIERNGGASRIAAAWRISNASLSRVLSGLRHPTFPLMRKFYEESEKRVTLPDWIEFFDEVARNGGPPPPSRVKLDEEAKRRERNGKGQG